MFYLQRLCLSKEIKNINLKGFNMVTNKGETKPMRDHT